MSDDRLAERRAKIAEWRAAGFIVPWDPADYPEPDPRAEWRAAGGWRGFFSRLFVALIFVAFLAVIFAAQVGLIR